MNIKYEQDYVNLLSNILNSHNEAIRNNRTASKTIMSFGKSITVDLKKGNAFPILCGRKMFSKTFFTELKWFIEGETNIKRFQDAGIKIWDKWADTRGELGPVYGFQLRKWGGMRHKHTFDQLNHIMYNLKYNPLSRRHVVTLWDPDDIDDMVLPPCYHTFTFCVVNNTLNVDVSMRSSDVFVGLPYDIALFATMLHLMCQSLELKPGKVKMNLTDAHIYWANMKEVSEYLNTAEELLEHRRSQKQVLKRAGRNKPPKLIINSRDVNIYNFTPALDLSIQDYTPEKNIKVDVVE